MENNKKENEGATEIRKPETDIIEGAHETDQLEKLKPRTEEERNTRSEQAGASPSCKESPEGDTEPTAEIPVTYKQNP